MVSLRWLPWTLACLVTSLGCATHVSNPCPGSSAPACITAPVCSTDPSRGCQVCRCSAPGSAVENAPPQGAPQWTPP